MSPDPLPVRGRPRDTTVERKVFESALQLAKDRDIRSITLELIAETSGVARSTIYRRWRNRSAVLADAFFAEVEPEIRFPRHDSAIEQLRQQMHLLAGAFRGRPGDLLRALLSEALTDESFQTAMRLRWIAPRRAVAKAVVERAISARELPSQTSPDVLLDVLYGGLYYWLLFDPGKLTASYIESIFHFAIQSLRPEDR